MFIVLHEPSTADPIVSLLGNRPRLELTLDDLLGDKIEFTYARDAENRRYLTFAMDGQLVDSRTSFLLNRCEFRHQSRAGSPFELMGLTAGKRQYATLVQWIQAFPERLGSPGFGSLYGHIFPLPFQWRQMQSLGLRCAVPRYHFGYGYTTPPYAEFSRPVFSNPMNLYHWKANVRREQKTWDPFVFEQPTGRPIIAIFVRERSLVVESDGEPVQDGEICRQVELLTQSARTMFKTDIGECVVFAEGASLTFGMMSPRLVAARKCRMLDHLVQTSLEALPD